MNKLLQKEYDKELKSIEVRHSSALSAFKFGHKATRARFASIDIINSTYDAERVSLKEKYELREKELNKTHEVIVVNPGADDPAMDKVRQESTSSSIVELATKDETEYYIAKGQKCKLRNWQQAVSNTLWQTLIVNDESAECVISGVGTGKTFMAGNFFARCIEQKAHLGKSFSPYPYVWVTKATIVEKTKRELEYLFGINIPANEVLVTNYDKLRSTFGKKFVDVVTEIIDGEPELVFKWKPLFAPFIILFDESHSLNRAEAQQTRVVQALNDTELPLSKQIHMSATPGTCVSDFQTFCVATRMEI